MGAFYGAWGRSKFLKLPCILGAIKLRGVRSTTAQETAIRKWWLATYLLRYFGGGKII